jgi:hypothetical protein
VAAWLQGRLIMWEEGSTAALEKQGTWVKVTDTDKHSTELEICFIAHAKAYKVN